MQNILFLGILSLIFIITRGIVKTFISFNHREAQELMDQQMSPIMYYIMEGFTISGR